jgi:hypothetical protein
MRDNPYDDDPRTIELEMWDDFVDRRNRPVLESTLLTMKLGRSSSDMIHATVPPEASEEDHPDHAISLAWRALQTAIDERSNRLETENWNRNTG